MRSVVAACLTVMVFVLGMSNALAQPNLMFNEFCYGATQNLPPNHPQHFVEIYNAESFDVDISSWQLQYGMSITFPAGTVIAANNYLVVTTPNQSSYNPAYNRVLLATND